MANITGDTNNVYINDANLKIVDTTKHLEAPKAVLSNISGTSLTTTGKVGVANTSPIHTLDIGSKVFIDEDDSVTLRVRGTMEVDGFNLASVSDDQIVFNNSGVLVGSSGLTFVQATNTLTTAGPLVAQDTASVADTLTLSKGSGTALVVDAGGAVDINSATDISEKLTLSKTGATALEVSGAVDINAAADISDTLTLSKASGTALVVSAGSAVDIDSATDISEKLTLSKTGATALEVSGAVDINAAADISDTLTLSKGSGSALVVAAGGTVDINSATDISETLTLSKASGTALSVTAGASVGGSLTVTGSSTIGGQVTLNNATTALNVASGSVFINNALQVDGGIDFNSTADIADTLTLSKVSGSGLVVTADASVGGALSLTKASGTALSVTADASVAGALSLTKASGTALSVTAGATIGDTLTLTKASGNGLVVTSGATVGGNLGVSGDLSVSGDLNVTGSVTAVNTTNLEVKDPIVAFGDNVTSAGDTGIIFNRSSGEAVGNVAMFYDVTATKFKMGYTDGHSGQTALETNGGELPVEIEGSLSLNKDLTVNTDTLKVDTTNSRVGINKAAPAKALDVVGDIESTVSVTTTNVYVTRIFFTAA